MLIEPLDPRRLMASFDSREGPPLGLDESFGHAGQIEFRRGFVASGPIVTVGRAIFVPGEVSLDGRDGVPYVVKLRDSGKIDTTFGVNGYAQLPFRNREEYDDVNEPSDSKPAFEFTQMIADPVGGGVYIATVQRQGYYFGTRASVTRLTASGTLDARFGTGGTYSYDEKIPDGRFPFASARFTNLNALKDGSLVLALDRQTRTDDEYTAVGLQNLALLKLRPNGRRDLFYGDRGAVQLLSGNVGIVSDNPTYSGGTLRDVKRAFFNDLQTDKRGNTTVLFRYEDGISTGAYYDINENDEATRGRFDLKSRTVSSTGVVDESTAYSWKLIDTGRDVSQEEYAYDRIKVPNAVFDGRVIRVLVTRGSYLSEEGAVYTLRPGLRATSQPLQPDKFSAVFSMQRASTGQYFFSNDIQIARYNADFTPDITFGDNGIANDTTDNFLNTDHDEVRQAVGGLLPDATGRFLALNTNGTTLYRFA
ncbi:MAG: hypothetical protein QM754_17685 [Tepidisphaeraceae bacterium]